MIHTPSPILVKRKRPTLRLCMPACVQRDILYVVNTVFFQSFTHGDTDLNVVS